MSEKVPPASDLRRTMRFFDKDIGEVVQLEFEDTGTVTADQKKIYRLVVNASGATLEVRLNGTDPDGDNVHLVDKEGNKVGVNAVLEALNVDDLGAVGGRQHPKVVLPTVGVEGEGGLLLGLGVKAVQLGQGTIHARSFLQLLLVIDVTGASVPGDVAGLRP